MANFSKIKSILILSLFIQIGFVSNAQDRVFSEKKSVASFSRIIIEYSTELSDKEFESIVQFTSSYFGSENKPNLSFINKSNFCFEIANIDIDDFSKKLKKEFKKSTNKILSISISKIDSKI